MKGEHRSITLNRERIAYLMGVAHGSSDTCVEWPYGKGCSDGRGAIKYRGRKDYAYRVVYRLATRTEIPMGMEVCHSCDNPACINPRHLFLGTHLDNFTDAKLKRRMPHGEDHAMAKLTTTHLREIRKLYKRGRPGKQCPNGISQHEIAKEFGVSRTLISRIVCGKHRDDEVPK